MSGIRYPSDTDYIVILRFIVGQEMKIWNEERSPLVSTRGGTMFLFLYFPGQDNFCPCILAWGQKFWPGCNFWRFWNFVESWEIYVLLWGIQLSNFGKFLDKILAWSLFFPCLVRAKIWTPPLASTLKPTNFLNYLIMIRFIIWTMFNFRYDNETICIQFEITLEMDRKRITTY